MNGNSEDPKVRNINCFHCRKVAGEVISHICIPTLRFLLESFLRGRGGGGKGKRQYVIIFINNRLLFVLLFILVFQKILGGNFIGMKKLFGKGTRLPTPSSKKSES